MKKPALESLAGFLDQLLDPNIKYGELIQPKSEFPNEIEMPYFSYAKFVDEFIDSAYNNHRLDTKLDWPEWAGTPEAAPLFNDPRALEIAEPKELSRLLTVVIRRDRFIEGSLLGDFESGFILRIVQRAATIIGKAKGKGPQPRKLSSQQAGALGELLALAKLNSLGLDAYMSPEGAPGHDLIAIVAGKHKSIEVKTRQFFKKPSEITRWPVDLETKGDADFFLFVELDLSTISPTFYLLTKEEAHQTNKSFGKGQGNCYPAQVRAIAEKNSFSKLLEAAFVPI